MPCVKRGRPPGKARTLHCLDEHCRIVRQPLKQFAEFRRASSEEDPEQSDQLDFQHSDQLDFQQISPSPHPPSPGQQFGDYHSPLSEAVPSPTNTLPATAAALTASTSEYSDVRIYAQHLLTMQLQPLHSAMDSSRQACFCVPEWHQAKQQLDYNKFLLPAVRLTELADEQLHLVWWCSCEHQLESNRAIFAYHDHTLFSVEHLEGRADQCIHIQAIEVQC